ncbi:hypothetical protein SUGI_0630390 [Cryptomeria japonica]|nr:hypothetical protein SUGI_0630390 [Cryptomeria japonica]
MKGMTMSSLRKRGLSITGVRMLIRGLLNFRESAKVHISEVLGSREQYVNLDENPNLDHPSQGTFVNSSANGSKVNMSNVIGVAKDGALGQISKDRPKMLVVLEDIGKDINMMRQDFDGRISLLEDTINKVHKKLETGECRQDLYPKQHYWFEDSKKMKDLKPEIF